MERVKAKAKVTFENRSVSNNPHDNLACYEVTNDADVILEEEVRKDFCYSRGLLI